MKNRLRSQGQILMMALAVLMVLIVLVPVMVFFAQRDSITSVKQAASTNAFDLAEAGAEKAYLYVSQSTPTWAALMLGTAQSGYNFDASYTDLNGGTYAISIGSGPASQEVTVITVGRDKLKREVRSLKIVYANSIFGPMAIYAGTGAQIGGGVQVEWGGIMSPNIIDYSGAPEPNHPQLWSASSILGKDTDPNPPNCDSPNCLQWHSYYPNIPPAPAIDFDYYRTQAKANFNAQCLSGGTPAGSCYYTGSVSSWNQTTSGVVFVEGSLSVSSPGMYHVGSMIVMGNFNLPNGRWGAGSATMTMPSDAWKQYGNDWAFYRSNFDSAAPATFPGLLSTSYTTPTNCYPSACTSSKLAANGLLYIGGNFNNGGGGGGNSDIYGALYTVGSATQTANSGVTFYYNAVGAQSLVTTSITLSRVSWQNAQYGWPSSLP